MLTVAVNRRGRFATLALAARLAMGITLLLLSGTAELYAQTTPIARPRVYSPQASPPAAEGKWYYCDELKGYYPSVSSCPNPWREVPAGAPAAGPQPNRSPQRPAGLPGTPARGQAPREADARAEKAIAEHVAHCWQRADFPAELSAKLLVTTRRGQVTAAKVMEDRGALSDAYQSRFGSSVRRAMLDPACRTLPNSLGLGDDATADTVFNVALGPLSAAKASLDAEKQRERQEQANARAEAQAEVARQRAEAARERDEKEAAERKAAQQREEAAAAARASADRERLNRQAALREQALAQARDALIADRKVAAEKGPAYVRVSGVTWTVKQSSNEMNDRVESVASSIQKTSTTAAVVTGRCAAPGRVVFSALLVDQEGQPTLRFGKQDARTQSLKASFRINDDAARDVVLSHVDYRNNFELVVLLSGADGEKLRVAQQTVRGLSADERAVLGMMLASDDTDTAVEFVSVASSSRGTDAHWQLLAATGIAHPLDSSWRILVQVDSTAGPIILKIPVYDPAIGKLIASCAPAAG